MKLSEAQRIIRDRLQSRELSIVLGAGIVLLSLGLLAYYVSRNWAALTAYHWRLNYVQVAWTVLFDLCAYFVAILAWHSMAKRLAGADDLILNTKVYCYGAVAGRLPGIAWGIAARVLLYAQAGVSKSVVGLASLLEMMITIVAGVVFCVAATPFTLSYASRLGPWSLLAALGLGILLIHPRLVTWVVRKVNKAALPVALRYRDTLRWLFMYLGTWIISGLMMYATVRSVYPLPSRYLLQVITDWTLAGVLTSFVTFVPSSLGLKEVTLTLLMSRYMPGYIAVVAAILMRLFSVGYSVLWMLCAAPLRRPRSDARRSA